MCREMCAPIVLEASELRAVSFFSGMRTLVCKKICRMGSVLCLPARAFSEDEGGRLRCKVRVDSIAARSPF